MQTRRQFIGAAIAATGTVALAHAAAPAKRAAAPAARWQIGCYTRPWAKHDYRVALDAMAAAGFKFAGLMTSPTGTVLTAEQSPEEAAAIGAEVKKRGMAICSSWCGRFPVEKGIEPGIAGLRRMIDNSATAGCPNLLLGGTNEKLQAAYYKVVAECCAYAASKKVGLSVKPHGGGNSTGPQCRKLIEQVGHPNFQLWYDPGNIFYYSEGKLDPVDDAVTVDGLVVGMSVKDFKVPKEVNLTPGTGKVDFVQVMARLQKGGFRSGALVVECLAPGDLPHLQREAAKARLFVEQLVSIGRGTG